MKLLEIKTELSNLVQDASFSGDTLDSYINQAILYAGANVDLPHLKRIDTVDTIVSQAYTTLTGLTGGFSGKLRKVKDSDGNPITIYSNLELLMDEYPTMVEEGEVEAVALEGYTLWYQKIPEAAETLTCLYYRDPTTLSKNDDIPSDFPAHLHRNLFVHGAAWMVYDQIEDDEEGGKVNTKSQFWLSFDETSRHSGITKLREWIGKTRRHNISSSWSQ
jgi:hypothetical protein